MLFLGLMVTLPVPFGNTMPAISIIHLSLGFTTALGSVLGVASAVTVAGARLIGF